MTRPRDAVKLLLGAALLLRIGISAVEAWF